MKFLISACLSIFAVLFLIRCSDAGGTSPSKIPNNGGGKFPNGSIQTLSSKLDSFEIIHNELCNIVLDSMASGRISFGSPVNNIWDDSCRKVTVTAMASLYGVTLPSYGNPQYLPTADERLAAWGDTVAQFGAKARWVIRKLDTLIDSYANNSMSLAAYGAECLKLRDTCLTLPDTIQVLGAGACVMTAKASAAFWYYNGAEFGSYTQYGLFMSSYKNDGFILASESDKKILRADANGAGRGVIWGAITGGATGALINGWFGGCQASIYKGIIIGFKKEGTWLEDVGGWIFGG